MKKIKFFYLSWNKLEELCFLLAKRILKKKLSFDRIVCISRGGLVVARLFSDYLKLPVSNFTIVSYVSVGKTGKPEVIEDLSVDIKEENIFLVDEIVDHGTTLKKALAYLEKFSPQKITTLAPIIKPWSKPKPDFWQLKTEKWVVFPYEIRETVEDVCKIKENKNKLKELEKEIKRNSKKIFTYFKNKLKEGNKNDKKS